MKAITPREVINHGKTRWRVIIPKDLRNGEPARLFFDDLTKAEAKAKALTAARGDIAQGFHRLNQMHQGLVLHSLDLVKGDAEELLRAVQSYLKTKPKANSKPLSKVVEECLEAKEAAGMRIRYQQTLKCSLNNLTRFTTDAQIADVTTETINKWVNGNGWSPGTRKGYLTDARTLFAFAIKRGYCVANPALGVDKPTLDTKPPGIHTVDDVKHLLDCCLKHDKGLLGYIAPLYFGGLRPVEAQKLAKAHVGKDLLEVTPENSKTRRRRFIAINDTLKAWLAVKGVRFSPTNLIRRLRRLRKLAANKKPFPWPHDVLRHSFCSYALPVYGATKTAEWAGHSEQILFAHYRERVKPEDAEKYWGLRPNTSNRAVKESLTAGK